MRTIVKVLPAIGLGAALLLTGCSTSVGGSPVAGTSPATASTGTTSSRPATLGSIDLPMPPTTATSSSDGGMGRTSEPTSDTNATTGVTAPDTATGTPAATTSTPPPSTPIAPTTTTSHPSTTPGSATDPFSGATPVDPTALPGTVTPVGFTTPSGNIGCGFQPTKTPSVVCQIAHHTYPNPPQDCHGGGAPGGAVVLSSGEPAAFLCAGDVEGGGAVLAYGSMVSVAGLECVSRENGVTCRDTATGNHFRLATASYELVNGGKTTSAAASPTTASGLSRFTGTWGGHGRSLVFDTAGHGTAIYRSYVWCSENPHPPCDSTKNNQIVAGGKLTVTLTTASGATGSGSITASNDPAHPTGTHVTATISGYNLTLSIWPDAPFCAADTPSDQWNCGA